MFPRLYDAAAFALFACASGLLACGGNSTNSSDAGSDARDSAAPDAVQEKCCSADGGRDAKKPHDATTDVAKETGMTTSDCGGSDGAASALAALGVTGLTLIPGFSPEVTDYYAQCGSGPTDVMVTANAPAGGSVALSVETPAKPTGSVTTAGPAGATATASIKLSGGQAIVATVTKGSESREYWVRCLPSGFPPTMQWQTRGDACARPPGYYLVGFMSLPADDHGIAVVFDTNGVPVWFKDNGYAVYDVETLLPGAISFGPDWQVNQLGTGTTYPRMDTYEGGVPSTPDEHELRIIDSTHYVGISSAAEKGVDLTGLTIVGPDGGAYAYGPDSTIYACYVEEFNPSTGALYWKWSATDHIDMAKAQVVKGDGDLIGQANPLHCNALDVDPANGNILLSARNASAVYYIDKASMKILWSMGGDGTANLDKGTIVPVDDPFVAQHDVRLLPGWKETCSGGSGQISLFDDESYTTNFARGVVYDVVINDGSGCKGGTTGKTGAHKIFEFKTPKKTPTTVCGGMRVTVDDTRIIDWGQSTPAPNGLVFSEVDSKGTDLLDFVCPDGSSSFRAVKVPLSSFDLGTLRLTAGQ